MPERVRNVPGRSPSYPVKSSAFQKQSIGSYALALSTLAIHATLMAPETARLCRIQRKRSGRVVGDLVGPGWTFRR